MKIVGTRKPDRKRTPETQGRRQVLRLAAMGAVSLAAGEVSLAAGDTAALASRGVLDVVIIGAGLAGLTAARDLNRAGCDSFVVLEARNRVGGRTFNHELGHGVVSEAGGQWIGPGQTAIADLARELGVDTFPTYYAGKSVILAGDARVAQDLHGGTGGDGAIAAKLDELARGVPSGAPWNAQRAAELDKLTYGEWLAKQGVKYEDGYFIALAAKLSLGGAPAQLGLLHYLSMINSADCNYAKLESIKGGAQETRFVGGSQVLSTKMARQLGGKVRLSCPVRRISGWDRDVVEVQTDQGVVRARRVIVALNPALCNQIAFDPPLPDGRSQLQKRWPANAPMRKTVHVYERPFWRDDGYCGQIFQVGGPVFLAYDNSPPDGSVGVLSAFVAPGALPSERNAAERTLSAIYAKAFGDKALRPTQFHDFDWGRVDPWTLQCIHPIPPGFWTKWGKFLQPEVGRLIWSGTETADIWAGSMDGAVRSGHRAALQALGKLAQRGVGV
ncbi:amine oxidase [Burkholderia stagnalis]|uniref:Amine oxidase n=2 Tax=Burkholderia stagnalis TaxID=1503054 RepID=A0A108G3H3_9BURK|nr:amine oxidase [Burkholderia stagnalis]KVN75212.1 amine oxidase [Burkholderia stagnalis]KVO56682.1 amine oxidase [Burkholderia stagnalis]KVP13782.1 amine oxidase [Burkholderia stagnalis]KVW93956.1 amine oxidase [Burkholderia stagnalis]